MFKLARTRSMRRVAWGLYLAGVGASIACAADETPYAASATAVKLDSVIRWDDAQLIAVQDAGRYKTLDSFARESMHAMTGKEHLPSLSPMASLFEWLFNRAAYADVPIIRLKDKGVRINLAVHLPEAQRRRIIDTGMMTLREFLDPDVEQRIRELEPRAIMITAMRRVRSAGAVAKFLDQMISIVPSPLGGPEDPWYTPRDLLANLPESYFKEAGIDRQRVVPAGATPVPGITAEQATKVVGAWARLELAWKQGDAEQVQAGLDQLVKVLPTLAAAGVYPSRSQRAAEARYYKMDKFTWGWLLYFFGVVFAVPAMATRWRTPWVLSILFLVAALVLHAYGLALRWYILGRIPVANMFEAVVASAWVGIVAALLLECVFRTRIFVLAANMTGFLALVLATFVIPGGGTLTTILGILDDVMLRIHTVLIISSYALIFLAAVVAVVYLFGYYQLTAPVQSTEIGVVFMAAGIALWVALQNLYQPSAGVSSGLVALPWVRLVFGVVAACAVLWLAFLHLVPASVRSTFGGGLLAVTIASVSLAFTPHGFVEGLMYTFLVGGLCWTVANLAGLFWQRLRAPVGAEATARPAVALAAAEGFAQSVKSLSDRPVLAGAAPGDESKGAKLPLWLHHFDWSHLIILNMVFVMLFAGLILGAMWADYSWGRPWGWDPKEVFALNTWLIYAILIHIRFVVKNRGLWTAWLSIAGCAMMAFNWCFVNFFIVGLHSYA